MKKLAALLLAVVMTASMIGCGAGSSTGSGTGSGVGSSTGSGAGSNAGSSTESGAGSGPESAPGSGPESAPGSGPESAPGSGPESGTVILPENGVAEGVIGNTMRTYWFDFIINSAYVCDSFSGYDAADGYDLLVVDITVTNTFSEELPMFDSDFWVQWDSDNDDDYAYPVEGAESLSRDVLPGEYYLAVNETAKGLLLFEVPSGHSDYAILYLEISSDDEYGDGFVVYFEPDKR